MNTKKILYFFPDDITTANAGNKTRAINLLNYFKERNFQVDYVSIKEKTNSEQGIAEEIKINRFANKVYWLPRKPKGKSPIIYFFRYKFWDLLYYFFTYPAKSKIPTFLTLKLKRAFNNILKANHYDYIIISYVHCADLISNKALIGKAKTIIDTHDFLTAQFKNKKGFNLGATFEDEISRLNSFDEVWAISPEEQYVFNQFCTSPVRWVPVMFDDPSISLAPFNAKKYDLIYVGNDNEHNVISIKWFFEKVYPLLAPDLKICVIGKINKHISDGYPNVHKIFFADSLSTFYNDAKIALCPMLNGTGIKVKVIEALGFGLPVVCTSRGIDGLPNKQNNGCIVNNDPVLFAKSIAGLLSDEFVYSAQSKLARKTFNDEFRNIKVYKILDDAFAHFK